MTIKELESYLGVSLPEDYCNFLNSHAESDLPQSQTYPITEKTPFGESGTIDSLFTLDVYEKNGVNGFQDINMLIIGSDLFGYSTCMCLQSNKFGYIYYHDFEQRSLWDESQFYSMFENLAENIKDYIKLRDTNKLPPKEEGFESFYHSANSFSEFCKSWVPLDEE